MFEPLEFAALARQLVVGDLDAEFDAGVPSQECRLRTALGRAYYALYLATRAAIARRHGIQERRLTHGALLTYLQYARMSSEVRLLGQELQRLYRLRQKADYELVPPGDWHARLADPRYVELAAKQAIASARLLEGMDFGPVAALFSE